MKRVLFLAGLFFWAATPNGEAQATRQYELSSLSPDVGAIRGARQTVLRVLPQRARNHFRDGDTALHVSAGAVIIRYLAARGAKLDAKNKQGKTPLEAALARVDRSGRQLRPDAVVALRELTGDMTTLGNVVQG